MSLKFGRKSFADCVFQFQKLAIETRKLIDDLLLPSTFMINKLSKEEKEEIQKHIKLVDQNIKHLYNIFN